MKISQYYIYIDDIRVLTKNIEQKNLLDLLIYNVKEIVVVNAIKNYSDLKLDLLKDYNNLIMTTDLSFKDFVSKNMRDKVAFFHYNLLLHPNALKDLLNSHQNYCLNNELIYVCNKNIEEVEIFETKFKNQYLLITDIDFVKKSSYWVNNNYSNNITIGILGGMGSYATAYFFMRLLNAFPGDKEWDRPRILIDNRCTMPSRVRSLLYDERTLELVDSLVGSVESFINNQVNYMVFACNTSHAFLEPVYQRLPYARGKILNIIELCHKRLIHEGIKKVHLLASEGTIDAKIYHNILIDSGIEIVDPTNDDQMLFRTWIEAVKTQNITKDITDSFIEYVNASKEPVILGCTELPVLYEICKNSIKVECIDPLNEAIKDLIDKNNSYVANFFS